MKTSFSLLVSFAFIATGCSLAGDVSPSPSPAFAQAPDVERSASPLLSNSQPQEIDSLASGEIRGTVVNGSADGSIPNDLEVTLVAIDGQEVAFTQTTTIDDHRRFMFADVETLPARLFIITSRYQDVIYRTDPVHFIDAADPLELALTVFESTTDTDEVHVAQLHIIHDFPTEGVLRTAEVWVFANRGDQTVSLPGGASLVEIVLPEGASLIEVNDGSMLNAFGMTERGISYFPPLQPGEDAAELIVVYDTPFDSRVEIFQPMGLPVDSVVILLPVGEAEIAGAGVHKADLIQMGEFNMQQYVSGPLSSGETLELSISSHGFPSAIAIALGGLILVLVGGSVWLYRRRNGMKLQTEESESAPTEREALLLAIADLDDAYEAGTIVEEEYRQRREDLKRQVLDMMKSDD